MVYMTRDNKTRIGMYVEETVPFYNLEDFRGFFRVPSSTFDVHVEIFKSTKFGFCQGKGSQDIEK